MSDFFWEMSDFFYGRSDLLFAPGKVGILGKVGFLGNMKMFPGPVGRAVGKAVGRAVGQVLGGAVGRVLFAFGKFGFPPGKMMPC